jgi:hypothetical protein
MKILIRLLCMKCVYPQMRKTEKSSETCHVGFTTIPIYYFTNISANVMNSKLRIFEISGPTTVFNKKITGFESVICVPPGSASRVFSRDKDDPPIMTMDVLKHTLRKVKKSTNSQFNPYCIMLNI